MSADCWETSEHARGPWGGLLKEQEAAGHDMVARNEEHRLAAMKKYAEERRRKRLDDSEGGWSGTFDPNAPAYRPSETELERIRRDWAA